MGGKTAIATGLLAGVAAGGLTLGAVLLLAPPPATPALPTPSPSVSAAPASAVPSASAVSPSAQPSGSPGAPSSSAPSASVPQSGEPSPTASTSGSAFGVGEPAPQLRVDETGGGEIDLAALRGKPVWVNFMATTCPPCRDELPLMNGFAARYADDGLAVLAIDVRESEDAVDAFMQSLGVVFPVGLDRDGSAQRDWGALALPVHFWVDAQGVIRYGALGGIGPDVMVEGLKSIMPGVTVTP